MRRPAAAVRGKKIRRTSSFHESTPGTFPINWPGGRPLFALDGKGCAAACGSQRYSGFAS